jgi:geranylgeranyl diphosphate synthase type I
MPPENAAMYAATPGVLPGASEIASLVGRVNARLAGRWDITSGLLDSMCAHALLPPGKLFRPVLLLDSALAVGGDARMVLPAAAGAESGHVASLVHDDIIDDDDMRRGRSSVQQEFGVANAIVAGDAMIFDLFAGLAECRSTGVPADRIVAALDVVSRHGIDLCRGQTMESEICERMDFDGDAYLTMVKLKTAALFKAACECGAILAGGDDSAVRALGTYAENLGAAFQIRDDILPYTRDAQVIGKPVVSDVRNGRLTLPVILAYDASDATDRQVIRQMLAGGGDPAIRWATLRDIVERSGGLAAASGLAWQFVERALAALRALPPTASRNRLRGFAEAAIDRDR